ncbi:MAG: FAD-dependent oxidoreductase [Thermoleophilia bacterium]|nr:FAD-dependent oxidoreductase [Thermoleophilia bacterium]
MRVAVIGAGVSGLTAAHKLSADHEVTVFESADRIGGHSHTVSVTTPSGELPVDIGFIVFNNRNYPNFTALLGELGVAYERSNMSFSVADEHGCFEYAGSSLNALFATRRNIVDRRFHRMVFEFLRFNREAKRFVESAGSDDVSLRDYLVRGGYSDYFVERLIVPQVSAVWSADPEQLWKFPARVVFQFFNNHGILELRGRPRWRTITGGSIEYVRRLAASFSDRLYPGIGATAVTRGEQAVTIKLSDGSESEFDAVVLAAHSDQALALLTDATDDERSVLKAIPYVANDVVLHTDDALLPRRHAARASWNFHLLDQPRDKTTVTYWMNNLQNIESPVNYCVTLNLGDRVDPSKVLAEHSFAHPVFTPGGLAAQQRHGLISGRNRTHFCGAYWRWGFHEDGVWSALRVVDAINAAPTGASSVDDDSRTGPAAAV